MYLMVWNTHQIILMLVHQVLYHLHITLWYRMCYLMLTKELLKFDLQFLVVLLTQIWKMQWQVGI